MKISKKAIGWTAAGVAVIVIGGLLGFRAWSAHKNALPKGFASGNGRLEAKLVDVSAREPLRVERMLVDEGALVRPNQVVAQLDTSTLQADLAEANATIAATEEKRAFSAASISKQQSEIALADIELERSSKLFAAGAGSKRDFDERMARLKTAQATLREAQAGLQSAAQQVEAARAKAAAIQTRIDDATLRSPIVGRVLYRLAEPGEVLAPGGKALTLVNLQDVYMEVFLSSEDAARTKIGDEARITLDYDPARAIPASVTFVSPEAQFTPKQVETKSEREKLMFRVKLQVPQELASQYFDRIKTGVRGVGYVKLDDNATWPKRLQNLVGSPPVARND